MVLAMLLCLAAIPSVWAASDKRVVEVMTWNIDAGTDLLYVAAEGLAGVEPTYLEIKDINFSDRADLLAAEIEDQKPYLISLQEVTRWIASSAQEPEKNLSVDQLDLLMSALAARGQHYEVVAVNQLSDITLPVNPASDSTFMLRYTDRDVVLARSDLKRSELDISNIRINRYQTILNFPVPETTLVVPILRGWISADVKIRGKRVRFVNTHLESFNPTIQEAQAQELVGIMNQTKLPVVLAGDFNSNADQAGSDYPDDTPTYGDMLEAGYKDVWSELHPDDPGYTWPLYP
jgi:endonuclease/exonuclease/phosphatase family metal-dependent hydrolase